jgi:hypothetical protein
LIGGNSKNGYILKVNPAGNYLWAKSFYGNWSDVNAIEIIKTGNVIVGGRFSGSVDFDPGPAIALKVTAPYMYYFHLTSLDSMGNYVWAQTVTCSNQFNYVAAIASDSDDNIYLSGNFGDTLIFDQGNINTIMYEPIQSDQNTFICKYNNSGILQWAKKLTAPSYYSVATSKYCLKVDDQNKINLTGYFDGTTDFDPDPLFVSNTIPKSVTDVFLVKLNENGDFVSVDHFEHNVYVNLCNITYPMPIFFSRDQLPGITVLGIFESITDFDTGPGKYKIESISRDVFMSNYSSNYSLLSTQTIETNNTNSNIRLLCDDHHLYSFGTYNSKIDINPDSLISQYVRTTGTVAGLIEKFDLNGNLIWSQTIGDSSENCSLYLSGLIKDKYGNLYYIGDFNRTVDFDAGVGTYYMSPSGWNDNFIMKLDSNSNFMWAKKFGMNNYSPADGYDGVMQIKYDSVQNFIYLSGFFRMNTTGDYDPSPAIFNLTSAGNDDFFILKLDTSGSLLWGESFGGLSGDHLTDLEIDKSGNLTASARFQGTVDFDPGLGVFNLTAPPGAICDVLLKLDDSGGLIFAKQYPAFIEDIVIDKFNNLYCTGMFIGSCNFDTLATNFTLISKGTRDAFISKMDSLGDFINVIQFGYKGRTRGEMIFLDRDENIYISGIHDDTTDFDPGLNIFLRTPPPKPPGFYDNSFLTKLNQQFQLVWEYSFVEKHSEVPFLSFAVDSDFNIYGSGSFYGDSLHLDNNQSNPMVCRGAVDGFFMKISQCPYYIDSISAQACNVYTYNNFSFTQSGPFTMQIGCDSINILNLIIDTLLNNVYASNDTIFTTAGNPTYQWIDCATNIPITGATMDYYVTNGMGGSFAVITSNPNCIDTSACFNIFPLQISDQTASAIYFYPNPANDVLTIKSRGNNMESVSVLSVQGSLIREIHVDNKNEYTIDISDLTSGIYILKMETNNHSYFSKFIKQ